MDADMIMLPLTEPIDLKKGAREVVSLYTLEGEAADAAEAARDSFGDFLEGESEEMQFGMPPWPAEGQPVFTTGWGMTSTATTIEFPETLRGAGLETLSIEGALLGIAQTNAGKTTAEPFYILPTEVASIMPETDFVTVDGVDYAAGGDCWGDSGGPLVIFEEGVHKLLGVVSWGLDGCGTSPNIYAYVGAMAPWIQGVIAGEIGPEPFPPIGGECFPERTDWELTGFKQHEDCSDVYYEIAENGQPVEPAFLEWRCITDPNGMPVSQVCMKIRTVDNTPRWYTRAIDLDMGACCECDAMVTPNGPGATPQVCLP
jgi:hypothetical protein